MEPLPPVSTKPAKGSAETRWIRRHRCDPATRRRRGGVLHRQHRGRSGRLRDGLLEFGTHGFCKSLPNVPQVFGTLSLGLLRHPNAVRGAVALQGPLGALDLLEAHVPEGDGELAGGLVVLHRLLVVHYVPRTAQREGGRWKVQGARCKMKGAR